MKLYKWLFTPDQDSSLSTPVEKYNDLYYTPKKLQPYSVIVVISYTPQVFPTPKKSRFNTVPCVESTPWHGVNSTQGTVLIKGLTLNFNTVGVLNQHRVTVLIQHRARC